MKRRLTCTTLLIVVVALLVSTVVGAWLYYQREIDAAHTTLQDMLVLIDAQSLVTDPDELVRQFEASGSDKRITILAPDGTVLADSKVDPSTMENHADRPEIMEALATGWGEDQRSSDTTGIPTLYTARVLTDGMIGRVAAPLSTVNSIAWNGVMGMVIAGVVALVLAMLLARWMVKRALVPFTLLQTSLQAVLDGKPIPERPDFEADDELRPILRYLDQLVDRLSADLTDIRMERDKVNLVLDCMQEGLVLLDRNGRILASNRAARTFFSVPDQADASGLLLFTGRKAVRDAIQTALQKGTTTILDLDQDMPAPRCLRLFVRPAGDTRFSQNMVGVSLLLSDITEVKQAEAIRSDFTANVSHELKTPLTSIKGFTDMLASGMVTGEEDRKRFLTMIGVEVDRLISLINDILEISELENAVIPQAREYAPVLASAREVADFLAPQAGKNGVSLSVEGEEGECAMPPARLREVLLNLMENGVKYNRPGGDVRVTVTPGPATLTVTVADTGIGIPEEAQGRVFERFYRVDKGRSRAAGGTGLGLAIVKHIVALYGGSIHLESRLGEGTTIKVTLPGRMPS